MRLGYAMKMFGVVSISIINSAWPKILFSFILVMCVLQNQVANTSENNDEIVFLFDNYFKFFNLKDSEALAGKIFHPPIQYSNGKSHEVWATNADIINGFDGAFKQLRELGWDRSVITETVVCALDEYYALVELSYSRLDAEGIVIYPSLRKGAYILLNTENGWRIIADYAQQSSVRLSCSS